MFKQFMQNCGYPRGVGGALMLSLMNAGHSPIARWALAHLNIADNDCILDIGCGGGKNLARLLRRAPRGRVYGLDCSEVSVIKSLLLNGRAVQQGRAQIVQGGVSAMPFANHSFNIVTAFETIYFWPNLARDFAEVYRVLKPGGVFLICNAMQTENNPNADKNFWVKMVNLNLYGGAELKTLLETVGFAIPEIITDAKQKKLCILARKARVHCF